MSEEDFKWPSERVSQGGLFHPEKVKYSKETNDLLNLLMEESRLSMSLKKKMNYHLRNGDPLPSPEVRPPRNEDDSIVFDIIKRARNAKRKTLDAIKSSGAYEQTKYRPLPNSREPTDKAKLKLQEVMSGMKLSSTNLKVKRRSISRRDVNIDPKDQINELLEDIDERANWLAEMEEIGDGKQYRNMIHSQIAEKLRKIREIESKTDQLESLAKSKEMENMQF